MYIYSDNLDKIFLSLRNQNPLTNYSIGQKIISSDDQITDQISSDQHQNQSIRKSVHKKNNASQSLSEQVNQINDQAIDDLVGNRTEYPIVSQSSEQLSDQILVDQLTEDVDESNDHLSILPIKESILRLINETKQFSPVGPISQNEPNKTKSVQKSTNPSNPSIIQSLSSIAEVLQSQSEHATIDLDLQRWTNLEQLRNKFMYNTSALAAPNILGKESRKKSSFANGQAIEA